MTARIDLNAWRNDDGGFGPVVGATSEPESTAMIALAFGDAGASSWLADAQQADGSVGSQAGSVLRDVTAIAALAFPPGIEREHALDHLMTVFGNNGESEYGTAGWPWTQGAHGWTEPTAWGLLATRLRPDATARLDDAHAFFVERECTGGGWNYGAPSTLGFDLGPYVQTTAIALLGLGEDSPALSGRGLRLLERRWRSESDGLLTLATSSCALRRGGSSEAQQATALLARRLADVPIEDSITAAWVAFATDASGPWEAR